MNKTLDKELEKQIICTASLFKSDDSFDDERFMKARCAVLHSGVNRNKSNFTKKVIENAKDTFKNIPILANVVVITDKDGNEKLDYHAHDMHTEQNAFDEESTKTIYDERVVGIVPETNNFELIYDKETKNYYAYVDILLYRDYGNYACEVLESRGGTTEVSAEILCDDISFNAKDKVVNVGKMCMSGITLLGENIVPGMRGAHATTFSVNEDDKQSQLIKIMQELKESLDNYTLAHAKENSKEGGENIVNEKLKELLDKYSKTEEDITFEIEGLSDEELENKFVEEFKEDETTTEEDGTDNKTVTETASDEEGGTEEESNEDTTTTKIDESKKTENTEVVEDEACGSSGSKKKKNNSKERTDVFALSFNEISRAINNLISKYRSDDEWCYVEDVYDDNTFLSHDWDNNKFYKQSYIVDGDNITLCDDRTEVFGIFVTAEEKKALETMKASYSSIETELNTYREKELNTQKESLFASKDYAGIVDTEDYKSLQEEMANFSVEELTIKLDLALAKSVKVGTFAFKGKEPSNTMSKINFASTLVDNKPSKNSFLDGLLKK